MPAISANPIAHKVAFVSSSTPSLPIWWSSRTARSGTLSVSAFTFYILSSIELATYGPLRAGQALSSTHFVCDGDRSLILTLRELPTIVLSADRGSSVIN